MRLVYHWILHVSKYTILNFCNFSTNFSVSFKMSKKRCSISALHWEGKRAFKIFPLLRVPRQTVSAAIKRFNELGHEGDRPGRGRKRTINIAGGRQLIQKCVNRKSRVSMRKITRETGISCESVRRMVKQQLGLKSYKFQKGQLLTDENKHVRLQRCHALRRRAAGGRWEKIVFPDEKLVTIEQSHNRQNDRICSAEAPGPSATIEHRQTRLCFGP